MFLQLRTSTIPLFQQTVLKWQWDYFENSLNLTPSSLILRADQEVQVLKHANQWVETIGSSVTALQAMIHHNKTQSAKIFKSLAANFTEISS
jgi:anthranilate phosphoribosyltransferase